MVYLLELPDGHVIPCVTSGQALALARVFVALTTGQPATENDKRPAE
jgi:hypothetical protein